MTSEQLKKKIRQQIRNARQSISTQKSQACGIAVSEQLKELSLFQHAKSVACFLSFDGEIDTKPIIALIHSSSKDCLLPYLRPSKPNRLWFMPYAKNDELVNNRYGIPEVNKPIHLAKRISSIDLLLMPLVAFDTRGNRLGMGGGFYDATLSHLTEPAYKDRRPTCIGIAFEKQCVKEVPSDSWDYPIDAVITEKSLYRFSDRLKK